MKSGTRVVCPDCRFPQIQSTKDLSPGAQMKDAGWESVGWDMDSQRMGCISCGASWHRKHPKTGMTQIHTEHDGWVTLSRNGEAVSHLVSLPRK